MRQSPPPETAVIPLVPSRVLVVQVVVVVIYHMHAHKVGNNECDRRRWLTGRHRRGRGSQRRFNTTIPDE